MSDILTKDYMLKQEKELMHEYYLVSQRAIHHKDNLNDCEGKMSRLAAQIDEISRGREVMFNLGYAKEESAA